MFDQLPHLGGQEERARDADQVARFGKLLHGSPGHLRLRSGLQIGRAESAAELLEFRYRNGARFETVFGEDDGVKRRKQLGQHILDPLVSRGGENQDAASRMETGVECLDQ